MNWLSPLTQKQDYKRRIQKLSARRYRRGQTMSRREAARQATKARWGKC